MKEIKVLKFLLSPNDVKDAIISHILENSDLTRDEVIRSKVVFGQPIPSIVAEVSPLDGEGGH